MVSPTARPDRTLRAQRAVLALAVTGLVVFAASTVLRPPGSYLAWSDVGVYLVVQLACALTCALRGFGVRRPGRDGTGRRALQWPWLFIAAGLLMTSCGDLAYAVLISGDAEPPYPSVADWCYLAFFPAMYVGLLLLVRSVAPRFLVSTWFDGAVAGLGSAAVAWVLGFDQLISLSGGRPAEVIVNLSYPAGDLLMLVVSAAALTAVGWRGGRELRLVAVALAVVGVADTVFALRMAAGTYVEGSPLDALWPLSSVLIALAACRRTTTAVPTVPATGATTGAVPGSEALHAEHRPGPPGPSWWSAIALPGVFTVTGVAVLTYTDTEVGRYLAAAAVLAAGIRAALTFREVSALGEARRQARTDELTGLLNRRGFFVDLHASLARGEDVAVLVLDLNRFKEVNDALGHQAGDQLLREVSARVSGCLGEDQLLARLGGDEFVVLSAHRRTSATTRPAPLQVAVGLARSITEAMLAPFDLEEISVHVGASIGVVARSATGPDADPVGTAATLIQQADIAMYEAKTHGSGFQTYDASSDAGAGARLRTVEELRTALEGDELVLHYQPKVDLPEGRVSGVEALVRWQHPQRGLLPPSEFLPLAEEARLMQPLTSWVLRSALHQVARWRDDGLQLSVAVNVSASNLLDLGLVDQVVGHLRELDLPPGCLQIEITEDTVMADPERATHVVRELHALGVSVSIDDYGTGYSSLAYLRDLTVTELKLDQTFVQQLSNARAGAIVQSTVDLAHAMGLRMVAEGVEDADTARRLERPGVRRRAGLPLRPPDGGRRADDLAAGPADGDPPRARSRTPEPSPDPSRRRTWSAYRRSWRSWPAERRPRDLSRAVGRAPPAPRAHPVRTSGPDGPFPAMLSPWRPPRSTASPSSPSYACSARATSWRSPSAR